MKKVTELKKKAKIDFRLAQISGMAPDDVCAIAKNFFNLVRQQSKLKKKAGQAAGEATAKRARQWCHRHFWKYAKNLLDEDQASQVEPQFSKEQAHQFFTNTYKSEPHKSRQAGKSPPSS